MAGRALLARDAGQLLFLSVFGMTGPTLWNKYLRLIVYERLVTVFAELFRYSSQRFMTEITLSAKERMCVGHGDGESLRSDDVFSSCGVIGKKKKAEEIEER